MKKISIRYGILLAACMLSLIAVAATVSYVRSPTKPNYEDLVTHEFPRPHSPTPATNSIAADTMRPSPVRPSAFGCEGKAPNVANQNIKNDWVLYTDSYLCLAFPKPLTWRVPSELYVPSGWPTAMAIMMPVPQAIDAPVADIYAIKNEKMLQLVTGKTRDQIEMQGIKIQGAEKNIIYQLPISTKPFSSDGKFWQQFILEDRKNDRIYIFMVVHYPKTWPMPDPMLSLQKMMTGATGF